MGMGFPFPWDYHGNPWEWDHRCAKNRNGKSTRIRGFLNDMRHINPRFTYLLTYLLTRDNGNGSGYFFACAKIPIGRLDMNAIQ